MTEFEQIFHQQTLPLDLTSSSLYRRYWDSPVARSTAFDMAEKPEIKQHFNELTDTVGTLPADGTDVSWSTWLDWFEEQSTQEIIPSPPVTSSTPETTSSFTPTNLEERWQAVMSRSPDSTFFYCVKSTKIFCRPTCPSRRPVKNNVEYASTPSEAEAKGYRACKRCRPKEVLSAHEDRQAEMVIKAQEMLRTWKDQGKKRPPTLQELADVTGMSKFYLLRTFRKIVGKTPDEYAKSV